MAEIASHACGGASDQCTKHCLEQNLNITKSIAVPPLGDIVIGPQYGVDEIKKENDHGDSNHRAGGQLFGDIKNAERNGNERDEKRREDDEGDGVSTGVEWTLG